MTEQKQQLPSQQINIEGRVDVPETNDETQIQQVKVEDLPLDKKIELLKKYNQADYFQEGRFLDAQDSVNSWCLAEIVQVDQKNVNVHFDGWSNRWDVWYKANSYKVAPFRKHSRGYTGQNKIALRTKLTYSREELTIENIKVMNLIKENLSGLGAFMTTQYLRGSLFVYVDFLLQGNNYPDTEIEAVNEFLYNVLKLIVEWLKKFHELMPLFAQIKVNSDLYLIDENIAIIQSYPEVLDILRKIFCGCYRCARFYVFHDKNTRNFPNSVTNTYTGVDFEIQRKKDEEDFDIEEMKDRVNSSKNLVYGQFINFVNFFANEGGFDRILDILRFGNDSEEKLPLDILSQMVTPFKTCSQIFSPTFSKEFVEQVKQIVIQRIQRMSEKELKELDKEVIGRVLVDLKEFLALGMTNQETAQLIEETQLFVALRFLMSTYLEKRLKGLNDIKLIIDRIEAGQKQQSLLQQQKNMNRYGKDQDIVMGGMMGIKLKPPRWLTAEYLKDWIIQQKVLETVLGENTHIEIVKRSGSLLKFLARQNSLPPEIVELIWKCQLGKHEEMVRMVYNTIKDIVPFIPLDYIDFFYIKIQSVPASQFDEKFLAFLKDFTLESLESFYKIKSNEIDTSENQAFDYEEMLSKREIDVISNFSQHLKSQNKGLVGDEKLYGLPIFWDIIQDKSGIAISSELMDQAINSISEILKLPCSKIIKLTYLVRSIENLIRGESIAQSITIASNIINEFYEAHQYNDSATLTISSIIITINKQVELIDIIIKNIINYHQNVKEKLKSIIEKKGALPDGIQDQVLIGKHTHEITLNRMLDFLEFLIIGSNQTVTLGTENIDTLWKIFVLQPNFNSDQALFLKWINKSRDTNYSRNEVYLFNDEERKYFFTKILCNPTYVNFQKISLGQVKCFHKYFKIINQQERVIELSRRRMTVVSYKDLIGLDTLWHIAIESDNEKVKEESMDLLVDLHLKLDNSINMDEQKLIWTNFIDQSMKNLDSQNNILIVNTINLLSKFLDRYEGKRVLKPELRISQHYSQVHPLTILVFNKTDQTRKQVQVSYFQTVGYLRSKIAEAFDYQINEFIMTIKNVLIDPDEEDDKYIKEMGMVQQVLIQNNPYYSTENHPKFLVADNQNYFDKLFYLLSTENIKLVEPVWDLLTKLPVNAKLQQDIKDLSGVMEDQTNWNKILDPQSTYKLLYCLKIIHNLYGNRKDPKFEQWCYKFKQMGGFLHLLTTFVNLEIKKIETSLSLKCIDHLVTILEDFIMSERILTKEVLARKEQFMMKCLNLIDLVSDYTISQEKERGLSYEDINKRIFLNKQNKNKYKQYMAVKGPQDKQQQQQEESEGDDAESQEHNQLQQIYKAFQEQNMVVSNLFKFMAMCVFLTDHNGAALLLNYQNLEQMLFKTLLKSENINLRLEFNKKIKDLIASKSQKPEIQNILPIIQILLFKIQPATDQFDYRCAHFFDGLTSLIESLTQQDIIQLEDQITSLIQNLTDQILNREVKENNTQEIDFLLVGRLKLLKVLLQKFPKLKLQVGQKLTHHLLHECLFEVPQGGSTKTQKKAGSPKCKSQMSRGHAIKLLAVLSRDCLENLNMVLNYMTKFNENPSWRTNKESDWNISLMESEKSSTGYVGIKNLGCICYMNSLFQQLFMIPGLRNDVLSVRDPNLEKVEKEENMLFQLQVLFTGLLKSEKQSVNPKGFCHAFKDWEGQPTNVLEQMDVEEFFNMFMDRLESAIKGTPQEKTIQYHFGGQYASEMICKGCPHTYERPEPFLSIGVPVKNKKSVQEGLEASIQGELLEGENAYYCEKCDKKVDTLKRTCIKKLPRYLMLGMKRFEFDFDKMIRVKVNDYCEFPQELNMEPYTQEGLARREKAAKIKEEKGDEAGEEADYMDPTKYPQEYYDYKLTGIVVHSGTADSGHYYSFIADKEHPESGKWYEMNDHIVREFDTADIPQECFGGEDTFQGYNMIQMKSMKWRNAYLLFYERKTPIEVFSDDEEGAASGENVSAIIQNNNVAAAGGVTEADYPHQEDGDAIMQPVPSASIVDTKTPGKGEGPQTPGTGRKPRAQIRQLDIPVEIEEKIAYENQKYWQNRFLFGNEYHEFVHDVSLNWNTSNIIPKYYLTKNDDFHITNMEKPPEYERDDTIPQPNDESLPISDRYEPQLVDDCELKVFKFAAGFYVTVLQRAMNRAFIPPMLNLLKSYINKNVRCAQWLILEFCNVEIVQETLLQCTQKEMRKFIVGLLYCAMLKLYPVEKDKLNDYWKVIVQEGQEPPHNSILANFILILIRDLYELKKYVANFSQYFQVLARFASLGPESREFLLRSRMIGRLMDFFYEELSPYKEEFRNMNDIMVVLNEKPDMGLPSRVDKKQMSYMQDLFERRRQKMLMEATPKYKYLLETLSKCLRSCKSTGAQCPDPYVPTPYQLDTLNYEFLTQPEIDLVFPEAKHAKRIFIEAKKTRAILNLAQAYVHYTWNDMDNFNELVRTMSQGINDQDYDDVKPFLVLCQFLVVKTLQSENYAMKLEIVLSNLLETVKANVNYYKFMETIFDFIFKLTSRNENVRLWFYNKRPQWEWLLDWVKEYRQPPNAISQNASIRLYKKRGNQNQMQMHNNMYKVDPLKAQVMTTYRIRRLTQLTDQTVPNLALSEIDMDLVDMQDYKYKVGELIDQYNKKQDRLNMVQVDIVLDEMISVKTYQMSGQGQNENMYGGSNWNACDTDKLYPGMTIKSQYRYKLIEALTNQLEKKRMENSTANLQGSGMVNRNMQGGIQSNYRGGGMNGADDDIDIRMNMGGSGGNGGGNANSSNQESDDDDEDSNQSNEEDMYT